MNADDRPPLASPSRVERGDGIVEGRDVADVRPQSSGLRLNVAQGSQMRGRALSSIFRYVRGH